MQQNNISQYRFVWLIPGGYEDRWWTKGGDVVLDNVRCNATDLAVFIAQQRVVVISHYPSLLNMTSQKEGNCVSWGVSCQHSVVQFLLLVFCARLYIFQEQLYILA